MKWIRKFKKLLIGLLVLALAGGGTFYYVQKRNAAKNTTTELTATVKKGDIKSSVSGTSQLQPKETKIITAPAEAIISQMNLTRNMTVKKDDVLVVLTSATLESNLKKAKAQLEAYEADLKDYAEQVDSLQIKAPISGIITINSGMDVGVEIVRKAKIATIADNSQLKVNLTYLLEDAMNMKVGDSVELTIDNFKMTKTGTISKVGTEAKADSKGNRLIDVEVSIVNDMTLDAGLKATGVVHNAAGNFSSTNKAALAYTETQNVLAGVEGTIDSLNVETGDRVEKGQVIGGITNSTIMNDYATKKITYDQQLITVDSYQDQVDDLTIKAPFDGAFSTDFVDKKTNVLTSLTPGTKVTTSTQFGGVATMDNMLLAIQVDELDLPNIKVGMKADVKVDSIKNKTYSGEVTQVSTVGTTTNGVTYYDAVVSISNPEGLKYGMTATGEILIQNKSNILMIPLEALQVRGGKYYVTIKKDDGTKEDQHEIKIGIRSKTYVEVTDGLTEGQTVVIPIQSKTQTMSQDDINKLRQQFQQGQNGQGQNGQFQGGPPNMGGGTGGSGGSGGTGGGNR